MRLWSWLRGSGLCIAIALLPLTNKPSATGVVRKGATRKKQYTQGQGNDQTLIGPPLFDWRFGFWSGSEVNNKPMTERLLNPGPKIYFCN